MSKAFKEVITRELYEQALKKSWSIELDEEMSFAPPIYQWIQKKATQLGVPSTYISLPMLSAVAFTLGESYVKVCDSYVEPIIIYSLIAGRSGTNKSGSLSIITDMINKLPTEANRSNLFDTGRYF